MAAFVGPSPGRRRAPLARVASVTMFSDLLRAERERSGLTVEQAARRLGVSPVLYLKLEAGERPDWTMYDRVAAVFGWPRSFR
jgi:DNA-binding XRE family transcriptional regulator